jgi:RecJ-like exonuclease
MTCPRCAGLAINLYGDTRCLLCGWYAVHPLADPIITNDNMRWESVLCNRCHERSAIRGHELCRRCRDGRYAKPTKHCLDCKADTGGHAAYCRDCKRRAKRGAR